jgi:DNA-binding transcriptional LysR family regulator
MTPLRNVDLNLLKALDVLLDERSVTRAAARLALTQPALSGTLTRLRECFDDPLFVRAPRGIVPTQRALDLAAPVKQVLAEIEALLQPRAFDPAHATLTVSIAASDYSLRAVALPFLAALKRQAPGIRVALMPLEGEQVPTRLERGDIDIALLTPDNTPGDLHARRLFEERYVCAMRRDHPAAAQALTLDRFCELDHALVSYAGGDFAGVTDEALARLGRARSVTLSVKSFLILPELLCASDMVAVVPSRLVTGRPELAVSELPLAVPGFAKVAAWHERTHRDPGYRWVRELLFATCA